MHRGTPREAHRLTRQCEPRQQASGRRSLLRSAAGSVPPRRRRRLSRQRTSTGTALAHAASVTSPTSSTKSDLPRQPCPTLAVTSQNLVMGVWHSGGAAGRAGCQGVDQCFKRKSSPRPLSMRGPKAGPPVLGVVTSNAHDGPAAHVRAATPGRTWSTAWPASSPRAKVRAKGARPSSCFLCP